MNMIEAFQKMKDNPDLWCRVSDWNFFGYFIDTGKYPGLVLFMNGTPGGEIGVKLSLHEVLAEWEMFIPTAHQKKSPR